MRKYTAVYHKILGLLKIREVYMSDRAKEYALMCEQADKLLILHADNMWLDGGNPSKYYNPIWNLSQDLLQKMVMDKCGYTAKRFIIGLCSFVYLKEVEAPIKECTLRYVMFELYNKVWNEKDSYWEVFEK